MISSDLFDKLKIYNKKLVGIEMKNNQVNLNSPIFAAAAILDISKVLLYKFQYEVIFKIFDERADLLYLDTGKKDYWKQMIKP